MKLVNLYGPNDYKIDEVAKPLAGPDDVVVNVASCGICGSDVGYIAQGGLAGPTATAMPLGHELSAIVASVGANVKGFNVGDRVVVNPMGAGNQIGNGGSEGGFAKQMLVKNVPSGDCLYRIPDTMPFDIGALVEPLSVAMHAVNQSQPQAGEKAVVFGVGAIGLGVIVCLQQQGVNDIIAIDYSAERLARARELGARHIINPAEDDDVFALLQQHHGSTDVLGFLPATQTDIFIDCSGAGPVIKQVIDWCRSNARLVVAGLHKRPVEVDFTMLLSKELSITGSMAYPNEFPDVINMLTHTDIDVSPMISHHIAFDDFDAGLKIARSPDAGAKVMIEIGSF